MLRLVKITNKDGTFDSKTETQNAVKNHSSLVSLLGCIWSEVDVAHRDVGESSPLEKPSRCLFILVVDCRGDIDAMIRELLSDCRHFVSTSVVMHFAVHVLEVLSERLVTGHVVLHEGSVKLACASMFWIPHFHTEADTFR